jgi:hypothetical protein
MLQFWRVFIKIVVDIERKVLAGGLLLTADSMSA